MNTIYDVPLPPHLGGSDGETQHASTMKQFFIRQHGLFFRNGRI